MAINTKALGKVKLWAVTGAITLLWFCACMLVFGMRYEVNDDAIISNIAAGAYGTASQYVIYPNIVLGYLLKLLYLVSGAFNWFVVLQVALGIICFAYIGTFLLRRLPFLAGCAAFIAFLVLAGTPLFTSFHYVRYAAVFLATGFLLLAQHLGQFNYGAVIGALLVWVGFLVRPHQLVASGGVVCVYFIYRFVQLKAPQKRRAAITIAILVCLVAICFGIDWAAYRTNSEWAAYVSYNQLRMEISDYRIYFTSDELLQAQGVSTTDYQMLVDWLFYDTQRFSAEYLQQLLQVLPSNSIGNAIRTFIYAAVQALYLKPINLLFTATLLVWLLFSSKKKWLPFLGTLAGFGAMLLYLAFRARVLDRLTYGLLFAAILFCILCIEPKVPENGKAPQKEGAKATVCLAALLCVAALPSLLAQREQAEDYWLSRIPAAASIDDLLHSNNGEVLYLLDMVYLDNANGVDVWHAKPAGYFEDTVFISSWLMQSPFQQNTLAKWGIDNPYYDSLNRADVVWVDYYHQALKQEYINMYYDQTAQMVLLQEEATYKLFKLSNMEEDYSFEN